MTHPLGNFQPDKIQENGKRKNKKFQLIRT